MNDSGVGKALLGLLCEARMTTASSAGETSGLIALGRRGTSWTCFSATATGLSASNGTSR